MVYRPPDSIEQEQTPLSAVPIQYQTDERLEEALTPETPPEPPEPPRPSILSKIFAKKAEEDEDEDLEDVVALSQDDKDYIFGGTEDEMVSYPEKDVVSLSDSDKEFLFGFGTGDKEKAEKAEKSIASLTEVTASDREFLTGTGGLGGSPEPNSHTRNISENRPARRSTYSVSTRKPERHKSALRGLKQGLGTMRGK